MEDWLTKKCGEIGIKTLAMVNWKLEKNDYSLWLAVEIDLILLFFFAYQSLFDHLSHFPKKVAN